MSVSSDEAPQPPSGSEHRPVATTAAPAEGPATRIPRRPGGSLLRRLLQGKHSWGELEVWSSRYGYTSYSLIVYPPGSTAAERIRFHAMRSWPPIGLLLSTFSMLLAGQVLPLVVTVAVGAAVYAGGALLLAHIAGPRRRQIRTVQTSTSDWGVSELDPERHDLAEELVDLLLENERRLRVGATDAAGYEATWGEVWQLLGSTDNRRSSRPAHPTPRGRTPSRPRPRPVAAVRHEER